MITYASKFLCPQCSSSLNTIGDNFVCSTCAYTIPHFKNSDSNITYLVYELGAVSKELKEIKGLLKELVDSTKSDKTILKD